MIKFGCFELDFSEKDDWEYSSGELVLKEMKVQLKSTKINYINTISFENNDSPLRFIKSLLKENSLKSAWQSLCQEFMISYEKKDDEINFEIYLEDDESDEASYGQLKLYLSADISSLKINESKALKMFGIIRSV